jgi:hypothetical protein
MGALVELFVKKEDRQVDKDVPAKIPQINIQHLENVSRPSSVLPPGHLAKTVAWVT